jgi:hypothetical protein
VRISQHFKTGKQQPELDFVDIDVNADIPLFLDPYFLANRIDQWSLKASSTIRNYFQTLIDKLRKDDNSASGLLSWLHEPNETCLGLSKGRPRGRGVGKYDIANLYASLSKSKAVKTGVVSDIEDCHIFVDGVGKDKLSDMTTGIIRRHLIDYTQNQAKLNGIPLTNGVPSGYFWDTSLGRWNNIHTEMLIINNRKILLVPKGVVSFSSGYTPEKYYNKFILEYLQNDFQSLRPVLIQERKDGTKYVTKKHLKKEYPFDRRFLLEFTQKHPEIFREFRDKAKDDYKTTDNNEIHFCDIPPLCKSLVNHLRVIPAGSDCASQYHHLIAGILELIFYPHLIDPTIEKEINEGRKRVDIVYDNAARENFFYDLHKIKGIRCPYVLVECKNYSSDPQNPALDQLIGRFSDTRGRFGLLICRRIENKDLFISRCKDTLKDGHGLIIPITDEDIIAILNDIADTISGTVANSEKANEILTNMCRAIFMG